MKHKFSLSLFLVTERVRVICLDGIYIGVLRASVLIDLDSYIMEFDKIMQSPAH